MDTTYMSYKVIILGLGIINLIFATLFLLWSNSLIQANKILKKWIVTDNLRKTLDTPHEVDSLIMKMRKPLGFVSLLLVVVFIFLYFY